MSDQKSNQRVRALDWVKGILVVLMVVYHSLNYSSYHPLAFKYLSFLPPSFIFLSGFFITNSYFARYSLKNSRLYWRLISRGVKLILLCSLLNLGIYMVNAIHQGDWMTGLDDFVDNAGTLYLSHARRAASFYILIPIGYTLILAPLFLLLHSLNRFALPLFALSLALVCSYLDRIGNLNYHFGMVSAGIIGMAFGSISLQAINRIAKSWWIVVSVYGIYRFCSFFWGNPYPIQLIAVCASLLLLYEIADALPDGKQIYEQICLLGRYSLFGYIFQLFLIQIIVRILRLDDPVVRLTAVLFTTLLLTWLACFILEKIRSSKSYFDVAYRFVFA